MDGPLWFCFDRKVPPAELLGLLRLLHQVYATADWAEPTTEY